MGYRGSNIMKVFKKYFCSALYQNTSVEIDVVRWPQSPVRSVTLLRVWLVFHKTCSCNSKTKFLTDEMLQEKVSNTQKLLPGEISIDKTSYGKSSQHGGISHVFPAQPFSVQCFKVFQNLLCDKKKVAEKHVLRDIIILYLNTLKLRNETLMFHTIFALPAQRARRSSHSQGYKHTRRENTRVVDCCIPQAYNR